MVFSSVSFLFVFLPALLLVYFIIPARFRNGRNLVLLAFSLFFYAFGGPRFLLLMLVSILINYMGGLLCVPGAHWRRAAMWCAVTLNLGLLAWFKYASFLAENLSQLWTSLPVPQVTLPIGISFFTFQGLSYVLDVYRGNAEVERNPLRVALYISLFPQLVAGPIVRYTTVAAELRDRRETMEDFSAGAIRFLFGLAKKMLLANQLGLLADEVFGLSSGELTTSLAWLGALAYTGQIYFDFSGYSDMAIGLGRLFGFRFLENFNYPYISRSITEFWRRWHISLSSWFRDYVYIPLGGSRCSRSRHILNLLIVWALTGFWHGAAWTFLCWGLYFAILLIGEKFLWGSVLEKTPPAIQHIYALLFIVLGWVLFRSESLDAAFLFVRAMFGGSGGLWDGQTVFYLLQYRWELVLGIIAALPIKERLSVWINGHPSFLAQLCSTWGVTLLALVLFALSLLQLTGSSYNPFIYFRF